MVKANELRVGNWIADHEAGGYFQIEEIYKDSYGTYSASYRNSSIRCTIDALEPIPLTEEWLVKFGFVFGIELQDFVKGKHQFVELNCLCGYFSENDIFYYAEKTKLKYVHELQNLYFALRGQELEIKGGNNE